MNRLSLAILALIPHLAAAGTTIDPASGNSHAYAANAGWINARGDIANGAAVGEFTCSGHFYSANCGWINLGSGAPANGVRYQNNSATDFGVNTEQYTADGASFEAKLRGYAYGANIGWVQFEPVGDPRVNLATGQLLGHAYSANIGWIALSGAGVTVLTTSLAAGVDSDGDTIPDNWERSRAGNLALLTASGDRDGDGVPDAGEYLADTNPLDPADRLQVVAFISPRQIVVAGPFLSDFTWTSKTTRKYSIETTGALSPPFATALSNIIPDGGVTTFRRFPDPSAVRKFYRIRAQHPLAP